MTETMLAKAARAIYEADAQENCVAGDWDNDQRRHGVYLKLTKAALEAIREPSEAITDSFEERLSGAWGVPHKDASQLWAEAINAILTGEA